MTLKRFHIVWLCLSLLAGTALFPSCSDDDNEGKLDPQSPEYIAMSKATPEAMALSTLLSLTAGIDSLPDNWRTGYTVEPIIGDVLDESQPYVRTLAVNDAAEAIAFYNSLTGEELPATATSHTLTLKEEGYTVNLNVANGSDLIATISVQAKQLPHLSAIRLVPVAALGENADDFETYYHMRDVVFDEEDGTYWICARPANARYGKKDSHWFSFDITTKENVHIESADKDRATTIVPTKLGDNVQMMDYLIPLLTFLADPDGYTDVVGHELKDGLAGLGTTYTHSDLRNIAAYWKRKDIWQHLPFDKDYMKQAQINVYYKGYSSSLFGHTMHLWCRTYTGQGHLIASTMPVEWDLKVNRPFDFTRFIKGRGSYGETPVAGPEKALVVRYRSAKQMAHSVFRPDPSKAIENLEPVHLYRNMKSAVRGTHYYPGDVFKDENTGIFWFCGIPSKDDGHTAYFYTLDNRALTFVADTTVADGQVVSSTKNLGQLLTQLAAIARDDEYARTLSFIKEKTRLDLKTIFMRRESLMEPDQDIYYCATALCKDEELGKQWADVGVQGYEVTLLRYYHSLKTQDEPRHYFTDFYYQNKVDMFALSTFQQMKLLDSNMLYWRDTPEPKSTTIKDLSWNYDKATWENPSVYTMFNHRGLMFAEMAIDENAKLPVHLSLIPNTDPYWTDDNRYEVLNLCKATVDYEKEKDEE